MTNRETALTTLLTASIDAAATHIADLGVAQAEYDGHRMLVLKARLRDTWGNAATAIFVMEQLLGHRDSRVCAGRTRLRQSEESAREVIAKCAESLVVSRFR
jgi:hypothetical protein